MKILRGYKTELDPNDRQKTAMEGHGHAARFAYNWGLARWQELHAQGKKTGWMELRIEKLRRLSRRLSRKRNGSKNRQKAKVKIQMLHRHIADIRLDTLHKTTTDIVRIKRPSAIALEDLSVSGMMRNRRLSRAISDVGMYEFRRQVEYKARLEGIDVVIVDRFFPSSKTCNACGAIQDMPLSERVYRCSCCGYTSDRDLNAAKNLARMITVGSTGSACGGDVGPTQSADPSEAGSGREA